MMPKLILGLALILSNFALTMLTGCRGMGTQRFVAFAPSQARELETSSRTVLDVTCTYDSARADYNLRENLSMIAPYPKRWKMNATLHVERVVKGKFDEKMLQLHWLRDPTLDQCEVLGIPKTSFPPCGFTNGMHLRIGFNGQSGERLKNLKMMLQP